MDWTHLLQHYGYFAVIIGSFFEGETILMLGAYAVHQHVLNFWLLIVSAMIGGFIGDQLYYQIGKRYGYDFIDQRPKLKQRFQKASVLIENYPTLSILLMRFAWGLRTILPMIIGIKQYPVLRYMVINLLACFIWAFVVVSVGLQVSHWLHQFWQGFLHDDDYSAWIILAVIFCILLTRGVFMLISYVKSRR
ncbi:DedA family protein [Acinetobacter sp. ANC 4910]|uniref:DedA family protein n=1 Tax=Acinetobacter sp. ANC 4910 TaxID=2529850 RepID=UPI001038D656|nr:DedA family protein [Acinetobacter sp. ANC 4910]TCB34883.1 DedA family protein [Acinetobacter sp. ANC 4910]